MFFLEFIFRIIFFEELGKVIRFLLFKIKDKNCTWESYIKSAKKNRFDYYANRVVGILTIMVIVIILAIFDKIRISH
jgi:hypothetical protein